MRRWPITLLALSLFAAPAMAQEKETDPVIEQGRMFTEWFFKGEDAKLWEKFGPQMKQALTSADNLKNFRAQIEQQLGTEEKVTEETTTEAQGYKIYLRTSEYSKYEGPILTQWAIAADGTIGGFFVRPKQ